MRKKILLISLLLTMVLFLGPVLAQQQNYCLIGTPSFSNTYSNPPCSSCCLGCTYGNNWYDDPMVINDNDTSTKVGVCTSRGSGGGVFRGTYNSTVDFASPIPQIDKVEYLTLGAAYLQSGTITTYLYYGGSWQKIHSRTINTHTWNPSSGWTPPTYPTPRKVTITTGGPWNNVEKVRVAVNAVSGNNYCINTYVFEVRAFGSPSPYADIGLRFFNGSKTIAIAVESNGTLTSPLRIAKDGATYGIVLVNPGEMYDSGLRIQTSSGIKALRKYS